MIGALHALVLLRARQLLRAGIPSGRPALGTRRQGRQALLLLILLYLSWQIYRLGADWVSSHNAVARPIALALLQPALTALGSGAALIILFYAFSSLIGSFLDGRDLQLLLLAPVPPELIFGERILVRSLGFSGVLLIAVPALFAVGSGIGIGPWFYPAVLLGVLVLPIAPTSCAALVLLALLRWLPPGRARTISLVVGVGTGILFYIGFRLVTPRGAYSLPSLPSWLPTTWPARAITALGSGDSTSALTYSALSIGLAVVLFVLATLLSARVLGSGIRSYDEVRRRPRPQAAPARHMPAVSPAGEIGVVGRARPVWWPIFIKDWLTLRRDSRRLILFVYPLVIVAFNAFQILSRPRFMHRETAMGTTLVLLLLACMLLVSTTTPGILNWEGRSLSLLALAPVPPGGIVLSKWIVAALPPLAIVELALIGLAIYLGLPPGQVALLAVTLTVLIVAIAGATMLVNVIWPKLDVTNPRRPSSVMASIVALVTNSVVCAGSGILLFVSLFVWHGVQTAVGIGALLAGLIGIIVADYLLARLTLWQLMYGGALLRTSS